MFKINFPFFRLLINNSRSTVVYPDKTPNRKLRHSNIQWYRLISSIYIHPFHVRKPLNKTIQHIPLP